MELISLISGIASIILAILAIWISFYHKREADVVNQKTSDLLIEIKSDAKNVTQFAMPELGKWNDTMRDFVFKKNGTDFDLFIDKVSISIEKDIKELKNEIDSIKISNDSKDLNAKVEKIQLIANQTEFRITTEIKSLTEFLELESIELGVKSIRFKYNLYNDFQELLNEIYLMLLREKVSAWTYGETWILVNCITKEKLWQIKKEDRRSLKEVGINPYDKLLLRML